MEPATPSPSAESPRRLRPRWPRPARRLLPRTFQARLTLASVGVTFLTVALISIVVVNRLDAFFREQELADLPNRAENVARVVGNTVLTAVYNDETNGYRPPVTSNNVLDPQAAVQLDRSSLLDGLFADVLAQADVSIVIGTAVPDTAGGVRVDPAVGGTFTGKLTAQPKPGQAREQLEVTRTYTLTAGRYRYAAAVTVSDPYTYRASTVANIVGLLVVFGTIGLAIAVGVAAFLALRFSTPLRRLTEASRRLAEGDMSSRVPAATLSAGSAEISELSRQFNRMAARLEESVDIIRRDRDRSRDFLADVSHELRTPIAALRTFNELLQGAAGGEPDTRAEFLEASGQQLGRLDWLAQNLLELSKLDSGLLLLDVRSDDLRACVESAVEQVEPAAQRHHIELTIDIPEAPVVIAHDAQRIGQVVSNLVGNAVKFSSPGGHVQVALRGHRDAAIVEVRDDGVGIDARELPHIFERFYRGSGASEARSSGSGLGLAIVRSIVDMHHGRITVESRVGAGTTFRVILPRVQPAAEEPAAAEELPDAEDPSAREPTRAEKPDDEATPDEAVGPSARVTTSGGPDRG